jgi:TonB family protein
MRVFPYVAAVCLCLGLQAQLAGAQTSPPTSSLARAHVAPTYSVSSRCPDVRAADPDEAGTALVVLYVGPTGVPSKVSLRSSSGSDTLDNAALNCVPKLRFLPKTSLGDAAPMASWQLSAWKAAPAPRTEVSSPSAAAAAPPPAVAGSGPGRSSGAAAAPSSAPPLAEVRVCVDDSGKLTQDPKLTRSSGDSGFDAAALSIARAGSGSYRAAAGCLQLAIRSER